MPWMETSDHLGGTDNQKESKQKALHLLFWGSLYFCTHSKQYSRHDIDILVKVTVECSILLYQQRVPGDGEVTDIYF